MTAHSPVAAPAPLAPGDLVIVYPPYEPGQVGIVVGHPRVDTFEVPGIGDIGQEMVAVRSVHLESWEWSTGDIDRAQPADFVRFHADWMMLLVHQRFPRSRVGGGRRLGGW